MGENNWQMGQFVYSTAGRDQGRLFVIYDVLNESFVRVVDGDLRKVSSPKRKNTKHLRPLGQYMMKALIDAKDRRKSISDAEVRVAIAEIEPTKDTNEGL